MLLKKYKLLVYKKTIGDTKKNVVDKIVHFKKMKKFTVDHFFIGYVVFVLIVKNFIKNKKFYFALNL